MNTTRSDFFKKINDFTFIGVILFLIAVQFSIRKFVLAGQSAYSTANIASDLVFNLLLSLCLYGYYIKKYNPNKFRTVLMCVFFAELVLGTLLKNMQIHYSNEIVFVGFIGILITWINTHLNRKKFLPQD